MNKKIILGIFSIFMITTVNATEIKIANVSDKVFENYCTLTSAISSTIMTAYQYNYDLTETKKELVKIINSQIISRNSKNININLINLTIEEVKEYKIEDKEEDKNKLIEDFKNEIYNICIKG